MLFRSVVTEDYDTRLRANPVSTLISGSPHSLSISARARSRSATAAFQPAPVGSIGPLNVMLIATLTVALVSSSGRAAWFSGVLILAVYLIFAITLYTLPPRVQ